MSLVGELGTVIQVKASAAQFHEIFSCRPHIVTSSSPGNVQSCELVEGEWGKPGYVICWTFTRDNNPQTVKELVEVIDNENYITTYKLIEGCALGSLYKSFYSVAKITQKDEGSLVHFTYKYEKQNENVPDLESSVLQMMMQNVKDIDAHLSQQQVEIVKDFSDGHTLLSRRSPRVHIYCFLLILSSCLIKDLGLFGLFVQCAYVGLSIYWVYKLK